MIEWRTKRDRDMLVDLALLTGVTVHNLSRQLSLTLDQQYQLGLSSCLFPTHITMKQAFSYDGPIEPVVAVFDQFCKLVPPMDIVYEGVACLSGDQGQTIVWLEIQPSKILLDCHQALLDMVEEALGVKPGPYDGEAFKYHSTLAQGFHPAHDLEVVQAAVKGLVQPFHAPVSHGVMLITPPHKPESIEHSVTYRMMRLTGETLHKMA